MLYTYRPTLLRLALLLPTLLSACFEPKETLGVYPKSVDVAKCEAICTEYSDICIATSVEADGAEAPSDDGCAEECQDNATLSEKSGCVETFNAFLACAEGLTDVCEDSCEAKFEAHELCVAGYCEEHEHPACPMEGGVPQKGNNEDPCSSCSAPEYCVTHGSDIQGEPSTVSCVTLPSACEDSPTCECLASVGDSEPTPWGGSLSFCLMESGCSVEDDVLRVVCPGG